MELVSIRTELLWVSFLSCSTGFRCVYLFYSYYIYFCGLCFWFFLGGYYFGQLMMLKYFNGWAADLKECFTQ